MIKLKKTFKKLLFELRVDELGSSMTEYVLLGSILCLVSIASIGFYGGETNQSIGIAAGAMSGDCHNDILGNGNPYHLPPCQLPAGNNGNNNTGAGNDPGD